MALRFMSCTGKFKNTSKLFISPGGGHYLPIQMESVRIKHAKASTILVISDPGENVLQQDFIAVALINENILARTNKLSQGFSLFWGDVDEMEFPELRPHSQRVKWASGNKFLARFGEMLPSARESVNVHMEKCGLRLRGEDCRVGGGDFFRISSLISDHAPISSN